MRRRLAWFGALLVITDLVAGASPVRATIDDDIGAALFYSDLVVTGHPVSIRERGPSGNQFFVGPDVHFKVQDVVYGEGLEPGQVIQLQSNLVV